MSSFCSENKDVEAASLKRKSMKKYISKVFRESSISIVSSILFTVDIRRKFFRTVVLLFCLTGFLYQCITFLLYALQYPTDLEITLFKPDFVEYPGYTFCNNNEITRSKYCAKYPEHCTLADESVCKNYPGYCTVNMSTIPRKKHYFADDNMTVEEIDELSSFDFLYAFRDSRLYNGPFLRKRDHRDKSRMLCYSFNSVVESSHEPLLFYADHMIHYPMDSFAFHVQPEHEVLIPGSRPGIVFSVHSPYEAVNPFEKGIFMEAERMYKIFVSMDQQLLLPQPYKTNCINYTEEWLKNNRSGPRTKKMCIHKCHLEFYVRNFNCSPSELFYPSKERMCLDDDFPDSIEFDDEHRNCISKCKEECQKITYHFAVQERYDKDWLRWPVYLRPTAMMNGTDESGFIIVEVYLDNTEVRRFQHRPQYLSVELFSSFGGFIGIWLGISFIQVMDLLEAVCRIFTYICGKRCKDNI